MEYKTSRVEALRAGESRYLGKPCGYGHGALRHTKTYDCMVCRKARNYANKKRKVRGSKHLTVLPTPRADALAKGESTYIGSPCKYGHGTLKRTANYSCVVCAQEKTSEVNEKIKLERAVRGHKKPGRKPILTPIEGLTKKQIKRKRRRTAERERTPVWLTENDKWMMREAYALAALRTEIFGFPWEVDHVIPLRGQTVSGLHVPNNLQVIPKKENRKKGSNF